MDDEPRSGEVLMLRDRQRLVRLDARPELGPSLLLFRWHEPTITLGYAQRAERVLDEEAVRRAGIPVVRRPTGGRAILHVHDWTYSLVAPLDDPRMGGSLSLSLFRLSTVVAEALAELGVDCVRPMASDRIRERSEDEVTCFAHAWGHELTVEGRKLAGSAQRRLTRTLLTQGTILVAPGHERLAEFLAGSRAEKERAARRLRDATLTLADRTDAEIDFDRFATALGRAWGRAMGEGRDRRFA